MSLAASTLCLRSCAHLRANFKHVRAFSFYKLGLYTILVEFYERFLNLFIKKPWIPATLFFNSYALPQKPAQVLNNSHLPLFRYVWSIRLCVFRDANCSHVFATIENMQYKLLKLNLYFNFAQFIARATNEVCWLEIEPKKGFILF